MASLRLFLRSSTGPNRPFQPQSLGRVRDPVRARKRIIVTLRPSSSRYQAVRSSHLQRLIFYGPLGSPKGRPRLMQQRNAATSASVCGWLTSCSQSVGGADGATHSLVPGQRGWPQCHANQAVPATGLVDDAITPARKKGIVGQAGKPDPLPCRGNGFPAIRRRLTHGRVRYTSKRPVFSSSSAR